MTIAFSTKSNRWTSRYSFEPTCYANVGQQFLSTTPTGQSNIIHRHDVSSVNNLFYGEPYKSSLSVASNEDPSATKAYEALSLESSEDAGWTASVRTIDQEGVVESFVERENDFYAEFPKNSRITQANIFPVGVASKQDVIDGLTNDQVGGISKINITSVVDIVPSGILCVYNESSGIIRTFPHFFGSESLGPLTFPGTIGSSFNGGEFEVGGYDDEDSSLIITKHSVFDAPGLSDAAIASAINGFRLALINQQYLSDPVSLYVASPSAGNNMKGDYAVIDVETFAAPPDFELYAINVDQHKINLDHSLGQNN